MIPLVGVVVADHIDHSIVVLFRRNRPLHRMARHLERLGRSSSIETLTMSADNSLGHGKIVGCLVGMKVFLRGDMRMTSCLISSCVVRSNAFVESLDLGRACEGRS